MIIRPPVPKFNDVSKTPEPSSSFIDIVLDEIFRRQLPIPIEKRAIRLMRSMTLQNNRVNLEAIIYYCMKDCNMVVPKLERSVEKAVQLIDAHQYSLIENLCFKVNLHPRMIHVAKKLKDMLQPLICKLPQQLQNALTVKITHDIHFAKLKTQKNQIAQHARITESSLQIALIRLQPFIAPILSDLFKYFTENPLSN